MDISTLARNTQVIELDPPDSRPGGRAITKAGTTTPSTYPCAVDGVKKWRSYLADGRHGGSAGRGGDPSLMCVYIYGVKLRWRGVRSPKKVHG